MLHLSTKKMFPWFEKKNLKKVSKNAVPIRESAMLRVPVTIIQS